MAQQCNERVGRGTITWPCTLDQNHPGPHYATESSSSAGDRRRWEAEQSEKQRHAASGLAEFQGQAQTTAQRYTENPSRVPTSPGRMRLHQDCTPKECLVYDGDHGNRISAYKECPYEPGPPPGVQPQTVTDVPGLDEVDPRVLRGEMITAVGHYEILQPMSFAEMPVGPPTDPLTGDPVQRRREEEEIGRNGWNPGGAVPTKQRDGDQVLPTGDTSRPDIQSLVIADIQARRQVGIERYGQALQPHNGRDMLLDAYEEAMDLCIYLKGVMVERDGRD